MEENRGSHPNSRANLRPAQKGDQVRKKGKHRPRKIKSIIRELLKSNSYSKLVANKELTREIADFFQVEQLNGGELMCLVQITKALQGDTKAFNAVLDRMDGKPAQFVENSDGSKSYTDFLSSLAEDEDSEEDEQE